MTIKVMKMKSMDSNDYKNILLNIGVYEDTITDV